MTAEPLQGDVPATVAPPRITVAELLQRLETSASGLTSEEAGARLQRFGPNDPVGAKQASPLEYLQFFTNPLVIILLIASVVSFALGQVTDGIVIDLMVMMSVALNFTQTFRSQKAAERLRSQVAATASVLRDGHAVDVPRLQVVPGDVIALAAGDLVPGDACLLDSRDLHVQQGALTGESLPSEKSPSGFGSLHPVADDPDAVFLGTSVISGTAKAVVVLTGKQTLFGDIGARLTRTKPETEFERGTRAFGTFITKTIVLLVAFVVLVSIALHRDTFESLLFAIALAVGVTPEFLPMIISVTLSQGAVHMARRKVIVKHLSAIQNFGSMDILCSDKTGTLTSGVMSVQQAVGPFGAEDDRVIELARLNSTLESGIKSPLDSAILRFCEDHTRTELDRVTKLDEIPFDFERRVLSVVLARDNQRILICKGAPESVLSRCTSFDSKGVRPLDGDSRSRVEDIYRRFGEAGHRVLAVAWREVEKKETYSRDDERDLVLAGFITFSDPALPDAAAALQQLRDEGVEVKVLSGDNELVVGHVCSAVGLKADRVVTGTEVDRLDDVALASLAERQSVFARLSPGQKTRVIRALKSRGHVVGFLGDGINDAPSLRAADVGISVQNAVDVAKETAEIILLERSLFVLKDGILEGRKSFGNVMKYILMATSSNFGNMFSMAAASIFLPFLPMLPTQILLNNFLYDFSQVTIPSDNVDETYMLKPHRWDMSLIRRFMITIGPVSSVFDFLTFWVLLKFFHAGQSSFQTGWFVESLTTQTLVLLVIRTAANPFRSRPSPILAATVLLVVGIGIMLPYTPLATRFGFTPLPPSYFVFLTGAVAVYLVAVEMVKRVLMRDVSRGATALVSGSTAAR